MDRSRRVPHPNNHCTEDSQCSSPPHQPQVDPAQVATMQVLQGLVTAVNNLQQNQQVHPPHQAPPPPPQSKLHDFLSTKPSTFAYAVEPLDADDWLKDIQSKLQISQCGGRERVLYAMHQLTGAAADWWNAFTAADDDPDNISCTDLKTAFHTHHIPARVLQ